MGICAKGCAEYTRKQLDSLTDFVKRPQIDAKGLVYVKYNADGSFKSSVDKFYSQDDLAAWANKAGAEVGDLMLVLSGPTDKTRSQMNELRLHMGSELGLRDNNIFNPLWVVNFPLLEWDEESDRYHAMHHPFTSALVEDLEKLDTNPGEVRANAYDLVINGVEIGGGSIRIHDQKHKALCLNILDSQKRSPSAVWILIKCLPYGAPPHGGIAFGFDRLCAIFGGSETIRDYIAFQKHFRKRCND